MDNIFTDPRYLELSRADKLAVAKRYFDEVVSKDDRYANLSPQDKNNINIRYNNDYYSSMKQEDIPENYTLMQTDKGIIKPVKKEEVPDKNLWEQLGSIGKSAVINAGKNVVSATQALVHDVGGAIPETPLQVADYQTKHPNEWYYPGQAKQANLQKLNATLEKVKNEFSTASDKQMKGVETNKLGIRVVNSTANFAAQLIPIAGAILLKKPELIAPIVNAQAATYGLAKQQEQLDAGHSEAVSALSGITDTALFLITSKIGTKANAKAWVEEAANIYKLAGRPALENFIKESTMPTMKEVIAHLGKQFAKGFGRGFMQGFAYTSGNYTADYVADLADRKPAKFNVKDMVSQSFENAIAMGIAQSIPSAAGAYRTYRADSEILKIAKENVGRKAPLQKYLLTVLPMAEDHVNPVHEKPAPEPTNMEEWVNTKMQEEIKSTEVQNETSPVQEEVQAQRVKEGEVIPLPEQQAKETGTAVPSQEGAEMPQVPEKQPPTDKAGTNGQLKVSTESAKPTDTNLQSKGENAKTPPAKTDNKELPYWSMTQKEMLVHAKKQWESASPFEFEAIHKMVMNKDTGRLEDKIVKYKPIKRIFKDTIKNKAIEAHKNRIQIAMKEGKTIPQEVLQDYPELQQVATPEIPVKPTGFEVKPQGEETSVTPPVKTLPYLNDVMINEKAKNIIKSKYEMENNKSNNLEQNTIQQKASNEYNAEVKKIKEDYENNRKILSIKNTNKFIANPKSVIEYVEKEYMKHNPLTQSEFFSLFGIGTVTHKRFGKQQNIGTEQNKVFLSNYRFEAKIGDRTLTEEVLIRNNKKDIDDSALGILYQLAKNIAKETQNAEGTGSQTQEGSVQEGTKGQAKGRIRVRNTPQNRVEAVNTEKGKEVKTKYMLANHYHGSGAFFDRFNTDYIGTGEGNQAFGWGIYVSEKQEVAQTYANKKKSFKLRQGYNKSTETNEEYLLRLDLQDLAYKNMMNIKQDDIIDNLYIFRKMAEIINKEGNDDNLLNNLENMFKDVISVSKDELTDFIQNAPHIIDDEYNANLKYLKRTIDVANRLKTYFIKYISAGNLTVEHPANTLYNVNVWENRQEDVLDWNGKVTDEQLKKIKYQANKDKLFNIPIGIYIEKGITGEELYKDIRDILDSPKEASLFLLRAGIDGIKYPVNALSGGKGEKGYNYVVFDANAIKINDVQRYMELKNSLPNPANITPKGVSIALKKMYGNHIAKSEINAGEVTFTLKDGTQFKVNVTTGIIDGKAAGKTEFVRQGNLYAVLTISDSFNAKNRVTYHEGFHLARELFLIKEEIDILDKEFNYDEEAQANAFADETISQKQRGKIAQIFHKLWLRIKMLMSDLLGINFARNSEAIFENIRNGVYSKRGREENLVIDKVGQSLAKEKYMTVVDEEIAKASEKQKTEPAKKEVLESAFKYWQEKNQIQKQLTDVVIKPKEERAKELEKIREQVKNFFYKGLRYPVNIPDELVVEYATLLNSADFTISALESAMRQARKIENKRQYILNKFKGSDFSKTDIESIGKALDRITTLKGINKAFEVLSNIYDRAVGRKLNHYFMQTLRKYTVKPKSIKRTSDINVKLAPDQLEEVNRINYIIHLTGDALDKFKSYLNDMREQGTTDDQIEQARQMKEKDIYLFNMFHAYNSKPLNSKLEGYVYLKTLVENGKSIFKQNQAVNNARWQPIIRKSLAMLNVKSETMNDIDEKLFNEKHKGSNITDLIYSGLNLESLIADLDRYSKMTIDEYKQKLAKLKEHIKKFTDQEPEYFNIRDQIIAYEQAIEDAGKVGEFKGFWNDTFFEPLRQALNHKFRNTFDMERLVQAKFADALGIKDHSINFEIMLNTLQGIKPKLTYVTNTETGETQRLPLYDLQQLAHIYVHSLNPKMEKKLRASGISEQTVKEVSDFLHTNETGKKMLKFIDWVVNDFYPWYFQGYNKVFRERFGFDMVYEPIYTPSPTIYDEESIKNVGQGKDFFSELSGMFLSSMIARVETSRPLDMRHANFTWNLINHIREIEHFKALAMPMFEIRNTMLTSKVLTSIQNVFGRKFRRVLVGFMNDVATGHYYRQQHIPFLDMLYSRFATSKLGLNLKVGMKQLSSTAAYMIYSNNPAQFMYNLARVPANWKKIYTAIGRSLTYGERYHVGINFEQQTAMNTRSTSKFRAWQDMVNLSNTILLNRVNPAMWGDRASNLTGGAAYWLERYDFYKKNNPVRVAEDLATKDWELALERTQQSSNPMYIPDLNREGVWRYFTQFKSQLFTYFNNLYNIIKNAKAGTISYTKACKQMFDLLVIVPYVYLTFASMFIGAGSDLYKLLYAILQQSLSIVPIAGEYTAYYLGKAQGDNPYDFSTIGFLDAIPRMGQDIVKAVKDADKKYKVDNPQYWLSLTSDTLKATESLFGVPFRNIINTPVGWYDFISGKDRRFGRLLGATEKSLEYIEKQKEK